MIKILKTLYKILSVILLLLSMILLIAISSLSLASLVLDYDKLLVTQFTDIMTQVFICIFAIIFSYIIYRKKISTRIYIINIITFSALCLLSLLYSNRSSDPWFCIYLFYIIPIIVLSIIPVLYLYIKNKINQNNFNKNN